METIVIITEKHEGVPVEALEATLDANGKGFVNYIRVLPMGGSDGTPGITRFRMSLN